MSTISKAAKSFRKKWARFRRKSETIHIVSMYSPTYTMIYVTNEARANRYLKDVVDGAVGLDTEGILRKATYEERLIIDAVPAASKRAAILGLQILEYNQPGFRPSWDHTGIWLIQLAYKDTVWLLDLQKMKAIPVELLRILQSPDILKHPKVSGPIGLKACVEEMFKATMDKSATESNWAATDLSDEQKKYAALDAVAALRLYEVLSPAL
ncbi:ribonuclease H-like domain-containing protein [Mycena leptocephala]|nr:ribonuclease H-like domain-containing protein [Mycena leptocephala]